MAIRSVRPVHIVAAQLALVTGVIHLALGLLNWAQHSSALLIGWIGILGDSRLGDPESLTDRYDIACKKGAARESVLGFYGVVGGRSPIPVRSLELVSYNLTVTQM